VSRCLGSCSTFQIPKARLAEKKFLADAATVTRWRYGPPAVRSFSKKNPYFVLPKDSPTKAQDEVTYVRNTLGAGNIIDQLDDLLKLLETGQFSLLHFASHNVSNPTATAGLHIPASRELRHGPLPCRMVTRAGRSMRRSTPSL
jgi:hypothetical protein